MRAYLTYDELTSENYMSGPAADVYAIDTPPQKKTPQTVCWYFTLVFTAHLQLRDAAKAPADKLESEQLLVA